MRLIDADDLVAKIMMDAPDFMDGGSSITKAFIMAMIRTKSACPTIDATPVVRCKHCIHSKRHCCNDVFGNPLYDCEKQSFNQEHVVFHHGDWFCADGKPYCSRCGCEVEIGQDLCEKCMYEAQAEMEEYERMYEPTYNPEDGSM